MTTINLLPIAREYKNNGQHAEQVFRFTLTGELTKADNLRHDLGADCLDIQIKSARATVCKGTDLDAYLAMDAAKRYAYVTSDFAKAYVMDRAEWKAFATRFGTVTRESAKNGGSEKIRLGHETNEMREWLANA